MSVLSRERSEKDKLSKGRKHEREMVRLHNFMLYNNYPVNTFPQRQFRIFIIIDQT